VKKRKKTISNREILDTINQLEKSERMVDIRRNVKFTHSSICTIRDNADKMTEIAKS
jgi:hypothetical protein